MKPDEYAMLLDQVCEIHPKRRAYVLRKWHRRGWLDQGKPTDEFYRVQDLAANKENYIDSWDGRVVTVEYLEEKTFSGPASGIIVDCGDNGWYFHTTKNSWWLSNGVDFKEIAYAELHPDPGDIWRHLNYIHWLRGTPDRFHQKITWMTYGTVCDYSRASEGVFTHSHPLGKIGDCLPTCQCKFL